MKKIISIGLLFLIVFTSFNIFAQDEAEKEAIKQCALNYIEGYYQADADRMDKALHPELVKRTVRKGPEGSEFISGMGKTLLVFVAKMNKNENLLNPDEEFKAEVTIYDIEDNYATVKITNNQYNFYDYAHLYKWQGEWKIINVLWGNYPPPPPPDKD